MREIQTYDEAVKAIKNAILQSQYSASKIVNEKQLILYFGIGKYISLNSRNGFWGKGAIDTISQRLDMELPGLRGFSARNLRYMRTFYEEWKILDRSPIRFENNDNLNLAHACAKLPNEEIWNTLVQKTQVFPIEAFLSIGFSHHRLILSKIKNEEERIFYIKRCAAERFSYEALEKSIASYLGQLSGYLSVLDEFEKKPHENPSIGIILCKDMNKAFVDFVIRDYTKPMGVETYKTSKDMSEAFKKALPDIDDLKKLLDTDKAWEENK